MEPRYFTARICFVLLMAFCSCGDYLDVEPKGYVLLNTTRDYHNWLNDVALMEGPSELNQLNDFIDNPSIAMPPTQIYDLVYIWANQYAIDIPAKAVIWEDHYNRINGFNTVINGVDGATGSPAEKNMLKAEALLGRALEYFYLMNEYAPMYDAESARNDLAVPFVESNDISDPVPQRSSVQEIFDHIIADIEAALPDLPSDNSTNRYRGSVASAHSVLARLYFYAGFYTEAQENARLAIDEGNAAMIDYNGPFPDLPLFIMRPDAIYARFTESAGFICSLDYVNKFDPNDLRFSLLFVNQDNGTYTERGATQYYPAIMVPTLALINLGTSVQEMKLIIAEAAARNNDLDEALKQLNEIRINRFAPENYEPLQSTDQDTVLEWALRERELELPFQGMRWFDMRRLDKENRMETVYRYDAEGNVIATLPKNSPKYTLQIPIQVMQYHPDWTQNPWE
ncbi:RagB/SusD family nutrient uptake outer membrane protein [Muricauda oceani]|uniref:RagB/SusD family nutrient uptake outer membrane protein n=1 Tax=Flagellimonas oceani TaxID=2698672 RepID=A0A6G7J009_9FLAO|nr:RagB/SusD family nutrient uptake outer membrane protein [Allomuricauda oceani]MBW8243666.1 RagB/SusD family nutrient uptake outer membrane protein [Allomuricauda oceani]QII43969.1 RagB/SusD family nutrient uptake outer membrane protein [Allomuricauda oceani]